MRFLCVTQALMLSLLVVGCDDSGASDSGAPNQAELKAEAAANSGKSDSDTDLCLENGWYGDGFCDPWCLEYDEDCDLCDWERVQASCGVGELAVDTNDNDCVDSCVPDPDYQEPLNLPLGSSCAATADCVQDAYCAKESGRCDDGSPGVCTLVPLCEEEDGDDLALALVCGCDGYTHASPCWASSVGVNVDHEGTCDD